MGKKSLMEVSASQYFVLRETLHYCLEATDSLAGVSGREVPAFL